MNDIPPPSGKQQSSGFRFLDHTADIIIEAWGPTLNSVFEQAGYGFFTVLLDPKNITPSGTHEIEIEAHSIETLLYKWIEEFIFLFDAEQLVCTNIKVQSIETHAPTKVLRGTCGTEIFDPKKHEAKAEVKAMTFAEMKITQAKDEILVKFTLDL